MQYLADLPASSERKFLEHGLYAMQRRSGRLRMIPDEFVITSLDVIVHHDRKLGAGGFAEVFEADWRGTRVAVKILEKDLPASVGLLISRWWTMLPQRFRRRLYSKK